MTEGELWKRKTNENTNSDFTKKLELIPQVWTYKNIYIYTEVNFWQRPTWLSQLIKLRCCTMELQQPSLIME